MAIVHFYEKPGCINNTRQKQWLSQAGHLLIVHDLLLFPWAKERAKLRSFFGATPVAEWFNCSAPAVKNGAIDPQTVGELQAIELMIADPLLIRRPLLECEGRRRAGFDLEVIEAWLGLPAAASNADTESCPKQHKSEACRP
jgi:nitrogenase-associated protein